MSYYQVEPSYYRNPGPRYAGGSATRTVPGWGVLPNMAGPARIAVGQDSPRALLRRQVTSGAATPAASGGEPWKFPWWGYMLIPPILAGGLAYAVNRGWVGG